MRLSNCRLPGSPIAAAPGSCMLSRQQPSVSPNRRRPCCETNPHDRRGRADAGSVTQTQVPAAQVDSTRHQRRVGVGRSATSDSAAAGAEAAVEADSTESASLYLVFAGHQHDHEAIVAGVASVAPGSASIVGCSTGGEIDSRGPSDAGVVAMAIGGDGISVAARHAQIVGGDMRTAGESVADAVWDVEDRGHTVLLLLSDGLAGDQQDVVRGAYATTGSAVPLVGACAADGIEMGRTTLFHADRSGGRIGGNQVIGVAISSVAPLGVGVHHGWSATGDPVLITRSDGTVIHEIDDERALDRYLRLHGAPADLADDAHAFSRFAATHPIGLSRPNRVEMRAVSGANPQQGTISMVAGVPQGAIAYAMATTADAVLEATDVSCAEAMSQLASPPIGVLAFDSVARRAVMGGEEAAEVARISAAVSAPVAGFYSCGEFARVAGATGFHNHSLVTLAIS